MNPQTSVAFAPKPGTVASRQHFPRTSNLYKYLHFPRTSYFIPRTFTLPR